MGADVAILEAKGLTVDIPTEDGTVYAVRNVSFSIRPGSPAMPNSEPGRARAF